MLESQVDEIRESGLAVADARDFGPPPLVKAGIDFPPVPTGKPIDPAAIDAYRRAVVKAVEKTGDGEAPPVPEKIVEAAGRTEFQLRRDVEAARRRLGLIRSIDQAGRELEELRAAGPPPSPTLLATPKNCTVERERDIAVENEERRLTGFRERENYGSRLSGAERRIREGHQDLRDESCPILRRRLRDLRREFDRIRDRQMQLDVLAGEEAEIASVEKAIQRLRSGVLLPNEQVRTFRDRIADLLIPYRKARYDKQDQRIQEKRRVELLDQYGKKLTALKRRGPQHARARQQAKELEREASRLGDEIHALQQEQLTPEAFALTP